MRTGERSPNISSNGVCYAKKDFNLAKHPEIDVPNLQVIKLMQSFKSKEYVRQTLAWMHYYWYFTNDGIEFLCTYLNLPSEIVPATLKKSAKPLGSPTGGPGATALVVKTFTHQMQDGWGLATDGKFLFGSDGTFNLYQIDPQTLKVVKKHIVKYKGHEMHNLNELEYV
ncbi:hypothetical protein OROGR_011034 [Orobanche gracilis]